MRRNADISWERLTHFLFYDRETGVFYWRRAKGPRAKAGDIAGHDKVGTGRNTPYRFIGIDGKDYPAARLAWFYETKEWPVGEIDHRDLNPSNNRFDNLRPASIFENAQNRGLTCRNKSGFKGVSFDKQKGLWRATIRSYGKRQCLGRYATVEQAASAYQNAVYAAHREFARLA